MQSWQETQSSVVRKKLRWNIQASISRTYPTRQPTLPPHHIRSATLITHRKSYAISIPKCQFILHTQHQGCADCAAPATVRSAEKSAKLTSSQHASHVHSRPGEPGQAHLHAEEGHRWRSQQERASRSFLARRQVLEAQGHHQEALRTAFDTAEYVGNRTILQGDTLGDQS